MGESLGRVFERAVAGRLLILMYCICICVVPPTINYDLYTLICVVGVCDILVHTLSSFAYYYAIYYIIHIIHTILFIVEFIGRFRSESEPRRPDLRSRHTQVIYSVY